METESTGDTVEIHHQPPTALSALISGCQSTSLDGDKKIATEASLFWLLSLSPDISITGKEKEALVDDQIVHWYCGKDGAKACWPPALLTIGLLSFKRIDRVDQWRRRLEQYVVQRP
jgi:hypothetical protein